MGMLIKAILPQKMTQLEQTSWHLLDAGGIAMKEFGAALSRIVPTICWEPAFSWFRFCRGAVDAETVEDPRLQVLRLQLQHGYSHPVVGMLSRFADRTAGTLLQVRGASAEAPLICTTPFYAPVAERWKGPVIYYLTDFAAAYDTLNARRVISLDRTLCRVAAMVCPNSRRLADYLIQRAGCDPRKITVLPNATRSSSIRETSWQTPAELPPDLADLRRPIVGVIGNLAGNLDWELIEKAILAAPSMTWVFVGSASMKIAWKKQREARDRVLAKERGVRFVGHKPYGALHDYAAAFDVAVMPYRKCEPTFSGSSTRFYEHLAACRPMLATRGVEELTRKEPLLRLVDGAEQLAEELIKLERNGFRDGLEEARGKASQAETWDCRAQTLVRGFERLDESPVAYRSSALVS